jgi:hypothetical protein
MKNTPISEEKDKYLARACILSITMCSMDEMSKNVERSNVERAHLVSGKLLAAFKSIATEHT